jgi:hypothetical protein
MALQIPTGVPGVVERFVQGGLDTLERNGNVILAREEGDHYIQVWLRPDDGVYQLEYRDGGPSEHYQTRSASVEAVASAFSAWSRGETSWRDDFKWQSIGEWFTQR